MCVFRQEYEKVNRLIKSLKVFKIAFSPKEISSIFSIRLLGCAQYGKFSLRLSTFCFHIIGVEWFSIIIVCFAFHISQKKSIRRCVLIQFSLCHNWTYLLSPISLHCKVSTASTKYCMRGYCIARSSNVSRIMFHGGRGWKSCQLKEQYMPYYLYKSAVQNQNQVLDK